MIADRLQLMGQLLLRRVLSPQETAFREPGFFVYTHQGASQLYSIISQQRQ